MTLFGTGIPKSSAHVCCSWALNIIPETAASGSEGLTLGWGGGFELGGMVLTFMQWRTGTACWQPPLLLVPEPVTPSPGRGKGTQRGGTFHGRRW